MSGTDSTKTPTLGGPAVVLVEPQLAENVGFAARAMLNCGLTELRLVRPREDFPNEKARAAASGADVVLDRARVFADLASAVADLQRVYAATTRTRDMLKPVVTPGRAATDMRAAAATGDRCGVVFGPERSGLTNDQLAFADAVLTVPLNPAFASLNLAQAVMVVGYEWFRTGDETPPVRGPGGGTRTATKAELLGFFEHLEAELDACGFLHPPEMRPTIVRNLRNLFQRADLTEQEVRILRGVISGLVKGWRGGEETKRA